MTQNGGLSDSSVTSIDSFWLCYHRIYYSNLGAEIILHRLQVVYCRVHLKLGVPLLRSKLITYWQVRLFTGPSWVWSRTQKIWTNQATIGPGSAKPLPPSSKYIWKPCLIEHWKVSGLSGLVLHYNSNNTNKIPEFWCWCLVFTFKLFYAFVTSRTFELRLCLSPQQSNNTVTNNSDKDIMHHRCIIIYGLPVVASLAFFARTTQKNKM